MLVDEDEQWQNFAEAFKASKFAIHGVSIPEKSKKSDISGKFCDSRDNNLKSAKEEDRKKMNLLEQVNLELYLFKEEDGETRVLQSLERYGINGRDCQKAAQQAKNELEKLAKRLYDNSKDERLTGEKKRSICPRLEEKASLSMIDLEEL